MKDLFSVSRFIRWIGCIVCVQGPFFLICVGGFLGLFFCALMIKLFSLVDSSFGIFLFSIGLLCASRLFQEATHREKNILWFMIPCSTVEKYLAAWVVSSILIPLSLSIIYIVFVQLVGWFFPQSLENHDLITLFQMKIGNNLLHFFCLQPCFLFGSIYFKNAPFAKTLLLLTSVFILTILIPDFPLGDFVRSRTTANDLWYSFFIKIVWYWITPIFFTVLGFICLKEKEVHHGSNN